MAGRKNLHFFTNIILFLWLAFLILRSGIYVKRIYSEINHQPEKEGHFPEIEPCSALTETWDKEEYQLYRYRSLGAKCGN